LFWALGRGPQGRVRQADLHGRYSLGEGRDKGKEGSGSGEEERGPTSGACGAAFDSLGHFGYDGPKTGNTCSLEGVEPMDEAERRQLAMVAAQAGAISEALVHSREKWVDRDDSTFHALNRLIRRAHEVLGDSPEAELLLEEICEQTGMGGVPGTTVMAAAQQLQAVLGTLLAQEPGRVEELEREKQALEAKVLEAEARAVTIKDDELRDRCVDLLLKPGKADIAVGAACTVFEDRIRKVAGLPKGVVGVKLVEQALG